MTVRRLSTRRGWAVALAVALLKPPLFAVSKRRWVDGTRIPAEGGCLLVANHVSQLDPLTLAHMIYDHGRVPRFLAKAGLFEIRGIGAILRSAGQIPVYRATREAIGAYDAAVAAVNRGECVVVYPEGTITRDPDGWPMAGKSGAARIALATGAPVIPIAQWGVQEVLPAYSKRLHVRPRRTAVLRTGTPVPLDDLRAGTIDAPAVREATRRIMQALTDQVALLRDLPAPEVAATTRDPLPAPLPTDPTDQGPHAAGPHGAGPSGPGRHETGE